MLETPIQQVKIRSEKRVSEIAWFDDLCGGDTEYLGTIDPSRRSNYEHCGNIIKTADAQGFQNILLPTSYVVGQEVLPFAAAMATQVKNINMRQFGRAKFILRCWRGIWLRLIIFWKVA